MLKKEFKQFKIIFNIIVGSIIKYKIIQEMDSNEQSITSWASIVTNSQVTSVKQIQQLSFVQRLLSCIDDTYHWDTCHNFFSLYDKIKSYYEKQLRINIRQLIKNINVYTHPMELWEILLGMALYGKKKQMHITTIMSMDEKMQEQMMSLVTEIIDKLDSLQTIPSDVQPPMSSIIAQDKTIIEQLADENEQYREKIQKIKVKYFELDKAFKSYKEEKQTQLNTLKLKQKQFYEEITYSNIYALGSTISTPAEVVRDLFTTIKKLHRQKKEQYEKYKQLEQTNLQIKKKMQDSVKIIQENSPAKSEIQLLEQQLDKLRAKVREASERELILVKKVRQLQNQKQNLTSFATYVQKTSRDGGITQRDLPKGMDLQIANKKGANQLSAQYPQKQIHKQKSLNIFPDVKQAKPKQVPQIKISEYEQEDNYKATIRDEMDEMRLPAIKMKMQKHINYLKKENENLSEQIEELRNINKIYEDIISKYSEDSKVKFAQYQQNMQALKMQLNQGQQQNQQVQRILSKYMEMYHEKQKIYIAKIAQLQMLIKRKKTKNNKHADRIKKKTKKDMNVVQFQPQKQPEIKIVVHSQINQPKQVQVNQNSQIIIQTVPELPQIQINQQPQQQQKITQMQQQQPIIDQIPESNFEQNEIQQSQHQHLQQQNYSQQQLTPLPIGQHQSDEHQQEQYNFAANMNLLSNKIENPQHQQQVYQAEYSQQSSSKQYSNEEQNDMQRLQIAKSKMYYTSELISDGGMVPNDAVYENEQSQDSQNFDEKLNQLNRLQAQMKLEALGQQLSRIANQHDRINEEYSYIIKQCAQSKKEQAANKLAQLSTTFDKFSKQIQQSKISLKQVAKSYLDKQEKTIQLKDNPKFQALLKKNQNLKQTLMQALTNYEQIISTFQNVAMNLNTIQKLDSHNILSQIQQKTRQKVLSEIADIGQQNVEIAKLREQKCYLTEKVNKLQIQIKQYQQEIQIMTGVLIQFRIVAKATNIKNFQQFMKSAV